MRTTINIYDDLLAKAAKLAGPLDICGRRDHSFRPLLFLGPPDVR